MQQTITENGKRTTQSTLYTLDKLASMSFAELDALYRAAPAPTSVAALDGDPVGRMLAVRTIESTPLAGAIRRFAASQAFVWGGKSFASEGGTGTGINRVQVPGVLGRQRLFPFATHVGASAIDGRPAIILDYDLEENPPYIRKIHDEVREVSDALYLGPAMWKGATSKLTVLWFALDAARP